MSERLTARQTEFGDRFSALMSEFHDVVGPVNMDLIDSNIIDADMIDSLPTVEGSYVSEWIILTAWSDMEGEVYTSKYAQPTMAGHHQLGLIARWFGELF
jgi:hypothetical protein